jgi:hypothetical protein
MKDIVPWPDRNDPNQRFGLLFRRKRKTNVVKDPAPETAEPAGAEHVGNVTRSDDSLLVRKARAARYSKKYREGVVNRILSGKSTISQVRKELGLSERDLLDWINDRVLMQDQKIAKLGQIVEAVRKISTDGSKANSGNRQFKIHTDEPDEFSQDDAPVRRGATIDGRINRR